MRTLAKLGFLLALSCAPLYGQITRVTACQAVAAAGTASCAVTVAAGEVLIVGASSDGQTSAASDTLGLGWTTAIAVSAVPQFIAQIYWACTGTNSGSDTVSVTNTQFSNRIVIDVVAYSGALCTNPIDSTAQGTFTTQTSGTFSTGTLTTSFAGDVLFATSNFRGSSNSPTLGVGTGYGNFYWTQYYTQCCGLGILDAAADEDETPGSAGSYSASFTSSGQSVSWASLAMVAIRPSGAVPGGSAQVY